MSKNYWFSHPAVPGEKTFASKKKANDRDEKHELSVRRVESPVGQSGEHMPKQQRVHELAKELGVRKQELVSKINSLNLGFSVANYMSYLNQAEITALKKAMDSEAGEATSAPAQESASNETAEADVGAPLMRRRRRVPPAVDGEEGTAEVDVAAPGMIRRRRRVTPADEVEEEITPVVEAVEEPEVAQEAEAEEPAEPVEEVVEAEAAEEEAPVVEEEPVAPEEEPAPVEAEAAEEAPEEEVAEQEEAATATQEPEAPVEEAAEAKEEVEEAEKAPEQPAVPTPRAPVAPPPEALAARRRGGARVVGHISENVLKDRLAAEDKDFSPGPSRRRTKRRESQGSSHRRSTSGRRKRVVEGSDLYDSRSRRGRRRGSRGQQTRKRPQKTEITQAAEHKRVIRIEDVVTVGDLAHQMGIKAGQVALKLLEAGMMATVNTALDYETAALIADEFDYTVENVAFDIGNFYDTAPDAEEDKKPRAPVVTVMGHVDHGKTSLLDALRRTAVTEGEAGGITQHIGAYMVQTEGAGTVTFLDTPGHEAFTALRMRGAKVTDIVVLVVAADDGVMPQTVEAINHARDAEVPIIVAINKIDKPTANPERVKTALSEYKLIPEEWGGTTLFVEVSALQGTNIDELIETIALQAELQELKANPDRNAQGLVIEAELDIGRGPVATILVQRGTLRTGDIIVSGRYYGRVRTMHDDRGKTIEAAGPSQPVEITGLNGIPEAGEPIFVVEEERDAKRITDHVTSQRRKESMASRAKEAAGSLEDLSAMIRDGAVKELKIILKGDVQGSVEALKEAFSKLGNEEVRTRIIHTGVGGITENDVNLAASSEAGAIVVGFNVRPDPRAADVAEKYGVQILTHSIIYDAIEQVRSVLEGLLSPIVEEVVIGHAEVRDIFSAPRVGTIAGCYVTDGVIRRNARARLLRQGRVVYESKIGSLRRFKDDVREVKAGFECGASLDNYSDIKVGDILEVFEHKEVAATLD